MIVVHHLDDSRSQRILWLLVSIGQRFPGNCIHLLLAGGTWSPVPGQTIPTQFCRSPFATNIFTAGFVDDLIQRAPKSLLEVTPLGKSPVITDGDVTLAESTADHRVSHQQILAQDAKPVKWTQTTLIVVTHFAEGSLMSLIVERLLLKTSPRFMPLDVRPTATALFGQVRKQSIEPEIRKYAAFVEAHLEKVEWFAGGSGPTTADFAMSFPLECLAILKMAGPRCLAYVAKIQARPAYSRALEKGESRYAYKL
ncbi:Thioredoxin-like protein [Mycena venus]|uniref:Thioredoxin-like protein n=1 Tax=Mycena venus TaxID=2733690 RepID=A0A8H7CWF2_9AGAR|nr:Thioredoxin-like protein [Mycena venus]